MRKTKKLAYAALFAALIAVATAFIKFNTGINSGYLHFGDGMIYLAASVLPLPYAISAAAIGGALADILAGAAMWAPATAIIKALNTLPFILLGKQSKILTKRAILPPILSGIITIVGYLIAETILYSYESALLSAQFSLIQATGSAIIYYIFAAVFDRSGLTKELRHD